MLYINWGNSTQIAISRIHKKERCGKCTIWMTDKCPKEKGTIKPSASGFVCDEYESEVKK